MSPAPSMREALERIGAIKTGIDPHYDDFEAKMERYRDAFQKAQDLAAAALAQVEQEPVAEELEHERQKSHRLFEALEHIETTNQRLIDWSETCAERRVKAENRWREVTIENSRLRDQLAAHPAPSAEAIARLTDDQRAAIEIARTIATKFSETQANVFPVEWNAMMQSGHRTIAALITIIEQMTDAAAIQKLGR